MLNDLVAAHTDAPTSIGQLIWQIKYRYTPSDSGTPGDRDLADTWRRVADVLTWKERHREEVRMTFERLMGEWVLLPAGRIIAGAGTYPFLTLVNTFGMGRVPDDLGSMFDQLREVALTTSAGGGLGADFSAVRPRGSLVAGNGERAIGVLGVLEIWSQVGFTLSAPGPKRRCALLAGLSCSHPEIEEFIEAKTRPGRFTNFNLSVIVADAFMQAVKEDAPWALRYGGVTHRMVRARELWRRIIAQSHESSEPGVMFVDRMNRLNKLNYCEQIVSTNSCGEQPFPVNGSAPLASINLSRLVGQPFTPGASLSVPRLEEAVAAGIRLLDNVIDLSSYPTPAQAAEAQAKRRVGLGVTGVADALAMCGYRYGSEPANRQLAGWLQVFRDASYRASVDLARERGAFPLFTAAPFLATPTTADLPGELLHEIERHGTRNSHLNSIAPCGSISLLADNTSSGIEPIFKLTSRRTIVMPDSTKVELELMDYAFKRFRELHGPTATLPESMIECAELKPLEHLAVQATAQRYIDGAISKTINCPSSTSLEEIHDIYTMAYQSGCKGCTTYRPSAVRGAVLS